MILDFPLSIAAWLALMLVLLGQCKGIACAAAGLSVVLLMGLRGRGFIGAISSSGSTVWSLLAGFGGGLGIFVLLMGIGMISWPLARAVSFCQHASLLYSHFVLVLTILASVLWLASCPGVLHNLHWGRWGQGRVALTLSALCCVVAAAYQIVQFRPGFAAGFVPVIGIVLLKAALTGVGEEAFYRGLVQPSAVTYYGRTWGVIFQAVLYMLFHAFLTQPLLSRAAFLAFSFGLGLIFGLVTQATNGIGWAALVHTALDVVVEWGNIC